MLLSGSLSSVSASGILAVGVPSQAVGELIIMGSSPVQSCSSFNYDSKAKKKSLYLLSLIHSIPLLKEC